MEKFTPLAKNFTLPLALTALTNSTSDKGVLRKPRVREGETPGLEEKEVILKENFGFCIAPESLVLGGTESSEHLLWSSGCPGCGRRKLGTNSNNNFQH